jgi:hypothetical protein
MILELDETESAVLLHALESYLPTLAAEASRVERSSDARELWDQYRRLEAVQSRLWAGANVASPTTYWAP